MRAVAACNAANAAYASAQNAKASSDSFLSVATDAVADALAHARAAAVLAQNALTKE